jgi:hypothetical protein
LVDTQHTIPAANYVQQMPDGQGRFGRFGGQFAPETLMLAIAELGEAYAEARNDPAFQVEIDRLAAQYVGRPTPLYDAARFAAEVSGGSSTRIFFKREDLAHTGAHKINNALGQALLVFPSTLPSNSLGILGSDEKFVDCRPSSKFLGERTLMGGLP